jgi:hypothetical protein
MAEAWRVRAEAHATSKTGARQARLLFFVVFLRKHAREA